MKIYALICSFLFCVSLAFAQKSQQLEGKIISISGTPIGSINIINYTHVYGSMSNAEGQFAMPVFIGDSITFSSVHYVDTTIIIDDVLLQEPHVIIKLTPEVFVLQDIVLYDGFSMIDTTNKARGEIDLGLPFNTIPVEKTFTERRENYLKSNWTYALLNALNGKTDKLEKIKAVEKEFILADKIYDRIDSSFYLNIGIPDDQIYNFIDFYKFEAKHRGLLKKGRFYELLKFIEKKAPLFLKKSEALEK